VADVGRYTMKPWRCSLPAHCDARGVQLTQEWGGVSAGHMDGSSSATAVPTKASGALVGSGGGGASMPIGSGAG
jgi:hypothetical protein